MLPLPICEREETNGRLENDTLLRSFLCIRDNYIHVSETQSESGNWLFMEKVSMKFHKCIHTFHTCMKWFWLGSDVTIFVYIVETGQYWAILRWLPCHSPTNFQPANPSVVSHRNYEEILNITDIYSSFTWNHLDILMSGQLDDFLKIMELCIEGWQSTVSSWKLSERGRNCILYALVLFEI